MYRINRHITVGVILLFSCLFLSCNNTSLDDCEIQFIENLGISNETYERIQDKDRFLSKEELIHFKAAYFGDGSKNDEKNGWFLDNIFDSYETCRQNQPLSDYEQDLIQKSLRNAYKSDSLQYEKHLNSLDSLRRLENLLVAEMKDREIEYKRRIGQRCWYEFEKGWLNKFLKGTTTTQTIPSIYKNQNIEVIKYCSALYMVRESLRKESKPIVYSDELNRVINIYGSLNVDSNLVLSMPFPTHLDIKDLY